MKNITVMEQENLLTAADLNLLEDKLFIKLPDDYKMFLLKHNGGHPHKNVYPLIDKRLSDDGDVAWFFAFYEGEYENLLIEIDRYVDRVPKWFMPIARGSGGDLICLITKGDEYGKLYFWDHNWEAEDGEEVRTDNIYLIANNFSDFINSLYELDIKVDENNYKIWLHIHDKYSLTFSTQAKKYGSIVTDFFTKAPQEVEDYIMEEPQSTNELILYYEVKSENKRYQRIIKEDRTIQDSIILIDIKA